MVKPSNGFASKQSLMIEKRPEQPGTHDSSVEPHNHNVQAERYNELPMCFRLSYKSYLPEISQRIVQRAEYFERSVKHNQTIKDWLRLYNFRRDWETSNDGHVYETACFVAHVKLMADQYQNYIEMFNINKSEQVREVLHFILQGLEDDPVAIARLKNETDGMDRSEVPTNKCIGDICSLFQAKYMRYREILTDAGRIASRTV